MKVFPRVGFPDAPVLTLATTEAGAGLGVLDRGDRDLDLADVGIYFHDDRGVPEGMVLTGKRIVFTESVGTAAGVHSAEITIPAYARLHDVVVYGVALWDDGVSASFECGLTDVDGIFNDVDLKATDLLAGEVLSISANLAEVGADVVAATGEQTEFYSTSARTFHASVTVGDGLGTTGITIVDVFYFHPKGTKGEVAATFTAS